MKILDWVLVGVLLGFGCLCVLFIRREVIARPGSIELSIRLNTYAEGRGWSPGIARFVGDEMHWYRVFSLSLRPRRVLRRELFAITQRRAPDALEQRALPGQMVVLRCVSASEPLSQGEPLEIAMAPTTLTGFMSWLEAAPPGTASSRYAA